MKSVYLVPLLLIPLSLILKTTVMKKSDRFIPIFYCISTCFLMLCFQVGLHAQAQAPDRSITTYQYRHVPDDKIEEFVKRETTYWSKVAQKAIDSKAMSFWALLEKVGGYDLTN